MTANQATLQGHLSPCGSGHSLTEAAPPAAVSSTAAAIVSTAVGQRCSDVLCPLHSSCC